jgi:uncharacterized phage protein (predicted DNA packaging)
MEAENEQTLASLTTLDQIKAYVGIDGSENDSLLEDFKKTAVQMVEKILRLPLNDFAVEFHPVIKNAIQYAVAYMFLNRENGNLNDLEVMLSKFLSHLRKSEF